MDWRERPGDDTNSFESTKTSSQMIKRLEFCYLRAALSSIEQKSRTRTYFQRSSGSSGSRDEVMNETSVANLQEVRNLCRVLCLFF